MIRIRRAAAGAILAGVVAAAVPHSPAAADVTVSPNVGPRGGPALLTFKVTDDRPGAHTTRVELIPPVDTPIAEVYPMSVDGWAPLLKNRTLDKPIELIHGAQTTSIVSSVIWTRTSAPPSAREADLAVSLGPLPATDQAAFTVVQTYSDGTVERFGEGGKPAPTVRLVTAPEALGGHHDSADDPAAGQEVIVEETGGGTPLLPWILAGALFLALAFAAEGFILFTFERRPVS